MAGSGQPHGAAFGASGNFSPDAVAASLARGDGGFGRAQETYYDHPILRKAHWRWEIVWYFFIGGASAGSAALASFASQSGDPGDRRLVRNARYTALVGSVLSGALLVKDLGRPERFLNMLRIVKLKSPMSVGVYVLSSFSTVAGIEAIRQARADGVAPVDPFGWIPAALIAPVKAVSTALMASYTGVLISATAIPVWYRGRRHIPAIFVLSGVASAAALQNALLALTGPAPATSRKLELVETVAALGEAALLLHYERVAGEPGNALFSGPRGSKLKTWTLGVGLALPLLLSLPNLLRRSARDGSGSAHERPHRVRPLLAAACALAGGYVLREAMIEAGRDSADDPRAYLRNPE